MYFSWLWEYPLVTLLNSRRICISSAQTRPEFKDNASIATPKQDIYWFLDASACACDSASERVKAKWPVEHGRRPTGDAG